MQYKVVVVLLFLFCSGAGAQEVPKLRIDPAQSFGGTVSEYFEQVNYIPLETTRESLFGEISNLVVTESSYVVADNDTHAILFFNRAGKFISKVKLRNDEYPNLSFEADSKRVMIAIYNSQTRKMEISYYDSMGKKLTNDKNGISSSERNQAMMSLGNDYFLELKACYYAPGKTPVDTTGYTLTVYHKDKLHKVFFPFNESQTPCLCALGIWPRITATNQTGVVYVSTSIENGIYRLTRDSVQKLYTLVFPYNRTLSKDLRETKDKKRIDSLRDNIYNMQQLISGVSKVFIEGDLLLFKLDQWGYTWSSGSESTQQYNFIYNLKTGRLASLERMTPDKKNFFLPLIGGTYMSVRGVEHYGDYYYGNVPSVLMFAARENTKDKNPVYPETLQQYFTTGDRKSNPVIVQMKVKAARSAQL